MDKETAAELFNKKLNHLFNKDRVLYDSIVSQTAFLPKKTRLKIRLWHIAHDMPYVPECANSVCCCNVSWSNSKKTYTEFCSHACAANAPSTKEKRKQTKLLAYGDVNYNNREQYSNTILYKYGVENISQNEEIKKKKQNTSIKNHGVPQPLSSAKIQKRIRRTNLEKYGNEILTKTEHFKQTSRNTTIKKYDREHFQQVHILPINLLKLEDVDWLITQHHTKEKTLTQIGNELGVSPSLVHQKFKKFNIQVTNFNTSYIEHQLMEFLKEQYSGTIIQNNRAIIFPKEIDILLPEHNLAIECNGIFWHGELSGRSKQYHLNKTNMCIDNNIRLIHVFESEWVLKLEIVKSRINSLLGINSTIYARKCDIREVSSPDAFTFLNNSHMQGATPSSRNIGLYYQDELVALMTFGKPRYAKKYQWELIRYCNKLNTTVTGGAGRLFKHFIKSQSPNSIVSYSDNRWNTGNLYTTLGFNYSHTTPPNYFYFKRNNPVELFTRIKFQKHKLNKQLKTFDPALTEWQNMVNGGYDRIWDCGNNVYEYHILPN